MNALLATGAALRENADAYHEGRIDYDTFARRNVALWDSIHRSKHEQLAALLAAKVPA